jgi:hypothetical protein
MRARFAAVLPIALLAITGCKSNCCGSCTVDGDGADAQAVGFVNETCPIGGEAIDVSAAAADYNGNKVGFCCSGCEGGWNEMAESEKEEFIAKAIASNG